MALIDISIDSKIEDKVLWAENCFNDRKETLLSDPKIRDLIIALKKAVTDSRKKMEDIGLVDECRQCEEAEGGTCCGAGIENRYSGILLLINLLLGRNLPEHAPGAGSCFFLGPLGCTLTAKHVICINYICRKITDRINPEKLAGLRDLEGTELNLLFLLNERIKMILRSK